LTKLDKLEEQGTIIEYVDNSSDMYDIDVKFKRGILAKSEYEDVIKLLNLRTNVGENLTVINFDGKSVWNTTYQEFITEFCNWRLTWYVQRYRRLADLLAIDIQKYKDILLSIRKNVGGVARTIQSRSELKEFLTEIGVVCVDYIADLPVYRFTEDEKKKVEVKLKEANSLMDEYNELLTSEKQRRMMFVTELKQILSKYKRGSYGEN